MDIEHWTLALITRRCRRLLEAHQQPLLEQALQGAAQRSASTLHRVRVEPDCLWVWVSCRPRGIRRFADLAKVECGRLLLSSLPAATVRMLQERVWDWPPVLRQAQPDYEVQCEVDRRRASHRESRLTYLQTVADNPVSRPGELESPLP